VPAVTLSSSWESEVVESIDQGDRRLETHKLCVIGFLPTASPAKYDEHVLALCPMDEASTMSTVFHCVSPPRRGVNVECTAVAYPDASVPKIERDLTPGLGAHSLRTLSWVK